MNTEKITRYAYINTNSEAGSPTKISLYADQVSHANVWINSYGNPTYMLYLNNGDSLLCVDDYGALNGLKHIWANTVSRKKDL